MDRMWHLLRLNVYKNLIEFNETWDDSLYDCEGHFSEDITPFMNLFDSNNVLYSNKELYDYLHPVTGKIDYVYDTMTWPHCETLGDDMTGL